MLAKRIRVLNFDDSITSQSQLLSRYPAEIIDFTDLASSARLYMSKDLRKAISDQLVPEQKYFPTFLGSGDFHHISEILINQINEPTCLIVFDFHPDWDTLPPRFGCGSWVTQALKNKNISKCMLIGAGSSDLSFPALQTANLKELADNRLEIYPFRHKPSRVYLRVIPQNRSVSLKRGLFSSELTWSQLEGKDFAAFSLGLIKDLPSRKVYISIDKDCLQKKFALTNWEEGLMSLDQLLTMLKLIGENLDIIGLDIAGDYSSPLACGPLKKAIINFDHPREFSAADCPPEMITLVNEQTNLAILQAIAP